MSKLSKHQIREDHIHDVLAEGFGNLLLTMREGWKIYAGILGGLLVIALGAVLLWNSRLSKADAASALLAKVQSAYDAPISATGGVTADPDSPTFPDEQARRKEVDKLLAEMKAEGAGEPERTGALYGALEEADRGGYDKALKALDPLSKDAKLAPLALRVRAKLHEAQSKWDLAEADWKSLSEMKSETLPAGEGPFMLGQYYERRQEVPKAVAAYEQALNALSEAPDDNPLKTRVKARVDGLKGTP